MQMKTCTVCTIEKPLTTENFHRNKRSKNGFRSICKECRKTEEPKETRSARKKKWLEENKEKAKEYRRKYYLEIQQESNNEKCKIYRDNNKKKIRISANKTYHKNKEKISIQRSARYRENPEPVKQRQRLRRLSNPERAREINAKKHHKRRALMKKVPHHYDEKQWNNCKNYFNNKCAYCGESKPLVQEHFIPVSKGGEYTVNNIVPSCQNCNSRKNNKNFFEWYRNDFSYSSSREKKVLDFLNYENNIQQLSIL